MANRSNSFLRNRLLAGVATGVLLAGAPALVHAETAAIEAPVTEVVITASSTKQKLTDAPASVSVISEEDLHERPVRDLTEALDKVEGVTINRAGNQRTIQLRGLGSAYTLIMIDGKRVSSTSAMFRGNDFDAGWVPVEAISRVEVVRGPMSSLYGSDAIGGVVNIITRPVGNVWTGSVSADYIAQENRDAGDAYKTGFFASGPLIENVLGLKVYGGYNRRLADGRVNPDPTIPGIADKHEGYLDGTLVWNVNDANTVSANYGYNKLTHDGFPMERNSYALVHKGAYSFGSTQLRYSGDTIRNEVGNVTGQTNPNEAANAQLDGHVTLPLESWRQTFTFGAEWRQQKLTDPANLRGLPDTPTYNQNPQTQVEQSAYFFEDEVRFTDNIRLTVGDRYDDHENFGDHHSPRVYLVWHLTPRLTLKTGASKAFRAPTLLQNSPNWGSVSCGSATTGCYIIGSTELRPETATSVELGLRYQSKQLTAGVTVFDTDLKNMIDITNRTRDVLLAPTYDNFVGFLPDGRPIFRYQNIAKVKSRGLEANVAYDIGDAWEVSANYTYLDVKNLSNPEPIGMIYQPEHSANATLNWRLSEKLRLFASVNYVGKQYLAVYTNAAYNVELDGYATADIGGSYALTDSVTLRAGILNAANKIIERDNTTEYNEDGRRYFVAVTRRF